MLDVTLTIDSRAFDRAMRTFPALFAENLGDALHAIGLDHETRINRMHRAAPPTGGLIPRKSASSALSRNTGTLLGASSHGTKVTRAKSASQVSMERFVGRGLPDRRAIAQEFGATIRPKTAKVLAVPTTFAKTQGNDVRGTSPRDFEGFWTTSKAGNPVFFSTEQGGGAGGARQFAGLVPLFIGLDEVKVPPRLRFFRTWNERKPKYDTALGRAADFAIRGRKLGGQFGGRR